MRIFFFIVLSAFWISWSAGGVHTDQKLLPAAGPLNSIHPDTLVKMERTVCFGTCPAYEVLIFKNGRVEFTGKEFVAHEGSAEGEIPRGNIDALIERIQESSFMKLPSKPDCESRMTDHPSVFLTIKIDNQRNSVTHYHGCKGFEYEDKLYDLETSIDSLAGVKKWVEGGNR